jgi:hypothetical protein
MSNIAVVRLIVIGVFFAGCVSVIFGSHELYFGISSKNWVPVQATVNDISESFAGRVPRKIIDYRYTFEHSAYSSSVVGFGLSNNRQDSVIYPLEKGDAVVAYVNASNPTQAALLRGFGNSVWALLGMGFAFIAFSLFVAFSVREIPESV